MATEVKEFLAMSKERYNAGMRRFLVVMTIGLALLSMQVRTADAQENSVEVTGVLATGGRASTPQVRPTATRSDLQVVPEGFGGVLIQPGYLMEMNIFDVPSYSGVNLRVSPEGDVSIPSLGPVHVAGETVPAAEDTIAKALVSGDVLVAPQVRLNILQYAARNVTVLGEVLTPGRIEMLIPRTLEEVIGLAGGETISAGNDVDIQHTDAAGKIETFHATYTLEEGLITPEQVMVYPGDTVRVHRAATIYVLGAVFKPGGYLMVNGGKLSVLQGLSLAGGTLLDAYTKELRILRPEGSGYHEIDVPFSKLTKGKADSVELQANDILYVPRDHMKVVFIDSEYLLGATVDAAVYRTP